ncbi:MAG: 4Fe-4S dicluster domain-containing protein, partial [Coriobacteriales bacterium]|nr:4Fe-4S dicluster domain-containing protein [Coriobacteriales bacterium]
MGFNALYYFSATGNSLAVALSLAARLDAAEPISVPGSLVLADPYAQARTASKVGFVFPVHRATLPEMVLGFIEQMPARPDCYYFAVSTYTLFGCNEFWDIDEVLHAQGACLNFAVGVKAMGNVGLGEPSKRVVAHRMQHIETQLGEIAEAVGNSQENYFRRSIKLLGKAVKGYTDLRRRHITFGIDERCMRCGICAQVCPAQNISIDQADRQAPVRSNRCQACLACIHWCPANAVRTGAKLHTHYHHPAITPDQLNP